MTIQTSGAVTSVRVSATHSFSKAPRQSITLIQGLGVQGDCHLGATVQHQSLQHIKPAPRNLRQVHLVPMELFDQVTADKKLRSGDLGENITTKGIDLRKLSRGTKLRFVPANGTGSGNAPTLEVTGLRNPGPKMDTFQSGLKEKMLVRDGRRQIVGRLAGVMAIVEKGGDIRPGMQIVVEEPARHLPLECV